MTKANTKPVRRRRPSRLLRQERRRWDDEYQSPKALGCAGCADLGPCGGLHKRQHAMSCLDDCCGNPEGCQAMCPRNPKVFMTRLREIDGFGLHNVPRAAAVPTAPLPVYAPRFYHGSKRAMPPTLDTAAIPLHALYHRRDGSLKYKDREEIAAHFRISPSTKIILVGCGHDPSIEAWWGLSAGRRELISFFRDQGFELSTAPNYSLFTNQLRYDDMHSIKRIGKAWQEFLADGMPCALHLNARTARDYERWAEFVRLRPEVTHVAFEFGTVWKWPLRQAFHLQQLAGLAQTVGRPLHLIMVGGMTAIPTLAAAYENVTYIDGTPFLKTIKRQRVVEGNDGTLKFLSEPTAPGAMLDDLYAANMNAMRQRIERMVSEAYAVREVARSAQMPEILDKTVSVPAGRPSVQDVGPKSSTHDRPSETVDRR